MTLDQFINNEQGKFVDVDGFYGAQCWDLVELYAEQVLQVPKEPWAITLGPNGSAYEAWTVFDGHMQKYFNKIPAGQEQRGDIGIYGPLPGDSAGHIDIILGNGQVDEQNAPYGSPVAIHNRGEYDLLGSLRLKGTDEMPINEGDLTNLWPLITGHGPTQADKDAWTGKDFKTLLYDKIIPELQTTGVVNQGDLVNIFEPLLGHDPTAQDNAAWQGKQWKDFAYNKVLPEIKNRIKE